MDEEGTEAAAATGILFRSAILDEVQFHCDRPFSFFIKEEHTGMTLFAGRFVQP